MWEMQKRAEFLKKLVSYDKKFIGFFGFFANTANEEKNKAT